MALYRAEMQYRAPWVGGPQEFYYWTNSYYFRASTFDDFDYGRDTVGDVSSRVSHFTTRLDWLRITNLTSSTVVQNSAFSWPANTLLVGDTSSIANTVLASYWKDGRRVGFNRFRSPVRDEDMVDGRLTEDAIAYYHSAANLLVIAGLQFQTAAGEVYDTVVIDPLVRMWQIRHGTKRSMRRALQ